MNRPPEKHVEPVVAGDTWEDAQGHAKVLAVVDGHVMLRRRRSNPFIASVAQMQRGDRGWRRVTP